MINKNLLQNTIDIVYKYRKVFKIYLLTLFLILNIVSNYFIDYTFDTSIHKIYHKVHVYDLFFLKR